MDGTSSAVAAPALSPLERFTTFLHAVAFVLGMASIFTVIFGLPTFAVGQLLGQYKPLLALAGGVVVIVFGLVTLGLFDVALLSYDTRRQWSGRRDWGYFSSYLMGILFAAGWSPCIGTTLGGIMAMSYSQATAGEALLLLAAYSLGLGVPFLLVGLGIDRATRVLRRAQPHMGTIKRATGVLLIGVGLLVLNDALPQALRVFGLAVQWPGALAALSLARFSSLAVQSGWYFDPSGGSVASPTVALAFGAGVLSFLSPCVLPLVPGFVGYLSGRAVQAVQTG